MPAKYVVIIPTVGRACLQDCVDALAAARGPGPEQVVIVDDRRDTPDPLPLRIPGALAACTTVVTLEGRGPAAARNAGWRAARPAPWVVFLDDDVRVGPHWGEELAADLAGPPGGGRPTGSAARPGWPARGGSRRTWPTGGRSWPRWAGSTSGSPGRSAKTPTWRCACATAA